jgi:phospholipid/cholesterol/gamma-HCH transport system substrate-binding protein
MKKSNGSKIRLTLFVITGTVFLAAAVYFIGQRQRMFSNTFEINGVFKDVTGLQIGNNVRFAGINIGTVNDIEITADTVVRVDMMISSDMRKFIKKDAVAVISSDGPLGNKIIRISPGTAANKAVADNDQIKTVTATSLDDVLANLKVTTENASAITTDLAFIMDNIRAGKGAIGKLFMDSTFAKNMDQTMSSLKQGAGSLKQNMDAAQHSFLLRGAFKKKDRDSKEKEKEKEKQGGK